jgi:hypothetical protein
VWFFVTTILATDLLVCFAPLDRSLSRRLNRWIFHAPDYRNKVRELGEKLRRLYSESEVTSAVETAVQHTLGLDKVQSVALAKLPASVWPTEIHEGQIAELHPGHPLAALLSLTDVELLVPVRAEGRVSSVLAVSPGPARRALVSQELDYLKNVAEQLGSRQDLLRLEREMAERQNRDGGNRLFTLYLHRSNGVARFDQFERNGLRVCVWQDEELGTVMAGNVSTAAMQRLASLAYTGLTI